MLKKPKIPACQHEPDRAVPWVKGKMVIQSVETLRHFQKIMP